MYEIHKCRTWIWLKVNDCELNWEHIRHISSVYINKIARGSWCMQRAYMYIFYDSIYETIILTICRLLWVQKKSTKMVIIILLIAYSLCLWIGVNLYMNFVKHQQQQQQELRKHWRSKIKSVQQHKYNIYCYFLLYIGELALLHIACKPIIYHAYSWFSWIH